MCFMLFTCMDPHLDRIIDKSDFNDIGKPRDNVESATI